jgi:hypothetical protein
MLQASIIRTIPIKPNSPSHFTRRFLARRLLRNIHLWLGPQRGRDRLASLALMTPPQRSFAVLSVQRTEGRNKAAPSAFNSARGRPGFATATPQTKAVVPKIGVVPQTEPAEQMVMTSGSR